MNGATALVRSEGSEVRIAVTGEVDLENTNVHATDRLDSDPLTV